MIDPKRIQKFVQDWTGQGYEKGQSQPFWLDLLHALGVESPSQFIAFEQKVHIDHTAFVDGYISATKVLIEQKSDKKELGESILQSGGVKLSPYQQAKRYSAELPYTQRPRWIVTCNFREFWVYDMEQPNSEPQKILLANLEKEHYRLKFLVDTGSEQLKKEMDLSIKAGELVGKIYDAILPRYANPESEATLQSLNQLCVRIVFCLFAEDAGLFGDKNEFHDYLARFDARDIRRALIDLFRVLDTKIEDRDPYLDDELKHFPYVNGGLFSNENIEIPQFTEELKQLILAKASEDFDWSEISPTIFGAVFESTLNQETRRKGGMHYTSIENIHKVIDPLFLNQLNHEFDACSKTTDYKKFQDKLASLTFFDPACGSGNFLTETYISLRRLENKVIEKLQGGQMVMAEMSNPIKVDIHQFYGIEINDFAVSVATTALWIAELQMMRETEKIVSFQVDPLPLKTYQNIHEGNALGLDWQEVIAPERLNYIMGNPPFRGARWMSKDQKQDVLNVFGAQWPGVGDLDYVCCWYKKTTNLMIVNPSIQAALVSTNSIAQGGAVVNLWKPLMEDYKIHINFAYPTFRWDSESALKAHVHCVIVGFSISPLSEIVRLYLSDGTYKQCKNINGYLVDGSNIFIEKRTKPLCNVPEICLGGQPIDDGNLVLSEEEKKELLQQEPLSEKFIRHYMMGKDFIDRKPRYCLWMKGANPADLRQCPLIMERIKRVREFRMQSDRTSTLKAAETPMLFGAPFESKGDYVAMPKVSSENRRYIPIDYLKQEIIPGDKLFVMQGASLYHFGLLTSNVHMAWMRAVCGRLKSDYSYSNTIVYNNFPWPTPTTEQQAKIEQTAQAILDARMLYPDCSLADLYDNDVMPVELRKAHQANDRAVMEAYGFQVGMSESDCVARLMQMYQQLTK